MADRDEHGAGRSAAGRRTTKAEAWPAFWDRLAEIYISLRPGAQRRIAELEAPGLHGYYVHGGPRMMSSIQAP